MAIVNWIVTVIVTTKCLSYQKRDDYEGNDKTINKIRNLKKSSCNSINTVREMKSLSTVITERVESCEHCIDFNCIKHFVICIIFESIEYLQTNEVWMLDAPM